MRPRCKLPRRSGWLEHNQCHSLLIFSTQLFSPLNSSRSNHTYSSRTSPHFSARFVISVADLWLEPSSARDTSSLGPRTPPWGRFVNIKCDKENLMFARVLDFEVKPDKKEEFVKLVKAEVLPILKK